MALNSLEDEIVTILVEGEYCDYGGSLEGITAQSCREAVIAYCREGEQSFSWEEQEQVEQLLSGFLRHSGLDCCLIAAACKTAWDQVNWDKISVAVIEFLEEEAQEVQ